MGKSRRDTVKIQLIFNKIFFLFLREKTDIYPDWRFLMVEYQGLGEQHRIIGLFSETFLNQS